MANLDTRKTSEADFCILLLGFNGVGKTTLIDLIKDPKTRPMVNYDDVKSVVKCPTRTPEEHFVYVKFNNQKTCLNIIDTPGFEVIEEYNRPSFSKYNVEDQIAKFVCENIASFHLICFVINANKDSSYNFSLLQKMHDFLGNDFSPITALVITKYEDVNPRAVTEQYGINNSCLADYLTRSHSYKGVLEIRLKDDYASIVKPPRERFLQFLRELLDKSNSVSATDLAYLKRQKYIETMETSIEHRYSEVNDHIKNFGTDQRVINEENVRHQQVDLYAEINEESKTFYSENWLISVESAKLQQGYTEINEENTRIFLKYDQINEENSGLQLTYTEVAKENEISDNRRINEKNMSLQQGFTESNEENERNGIINEDLAEVQHRHVEVNEFSSQNGQDYNDSTKHQQLPRDTISARPNEKNDTLITENRQIKEENIKLQQNYAEVNKENERINEENKRLYEENTKLLQKYVDTNEENGRISAENRRINEENARLLLRLTEVNDENEEINAEGRRINEETIKLQQKYVDVNDKKENISAENKRIEDENTSIRLELTEVNLQSERIIAKNRRIVEENARLRLRITEMSDENERRSAEIKRINDENTQFQEKYLEINKENEKLIAESRQINEENRRLQQKLMEINEENEKIISASGQINKESKKLKLLCYSLIIVGIGSTIVRGVARLRK